MAGTVLSVPCYKDSQNGALWTTWPEELRKSDSKEVQNKKKSWKKRWNTTSFWNMSLTVSEQTESICY